MFNPILLLSALSPEYIDDYVNDLNKCSVSGIVKKVDINKYHDCSDDLRIYISWDNWNYEVFSSKINDNMCEIDWSLIIYSDKTLPKVWDKVELLINKTGYDIISDEKVWEWVYKLISWNNSEWNTQICEPNSNFFEFYKDYFIIWTWIIFLTVLWVIVFKRFRKKW